MRNNEILFEHGHKFSFDFENENKKSESPNMQRNKYDCNNAY